MTGSFIFVTDPNADFKAINRLLIYLHDWEYGNQDAYDEEENVFTLLTTRSLEDVRTMVKDEGDEKKYKIPSTNPPVSQPLENAWAGASTEEVEDFVAQLYAEPEESLIHRGGYGSLFILVDEEGFKDLTCAVCQIVRTYDEDEEEMKYGGDGEKTLFNKVRMPWVEAYSCWCNLDIANMDFMDFVDDDEQDDGNTGGWYKSRHWDEPPTSEGNIERMDEFLEKFKKDGLV